MSTVILVFRFLNSQYETAAETAENETWSLCNQAENKESFVSSVYHIPCFLSRQNSVLHGSFFWVFASFGVFLSPLTFCCVIYIIVSVSIQKAIRSEMLRLRVCFVTFAPCTSSTRRSSALQNAQSELFLTLRPQAERIALFSRQRIKVYWTYTDWR